MEKNSKPASETQISKTVNRNEETLKPKQGLSTEDKMNMSLLFTAEI